MRALILVISQSRNAGAFPDAGCSVKKQPPPCLDTFRKKRQRASQMELERSSALPSAHSITGQSERKPMNELTTLFASILSYSVMHVRLLSLRTRRGQDLYSIMYDLCCLCITSLRFGFSFMMMLTETGQIKLLLLKCYWNEMVMSQHT